VSVIQSPTRYQSNTTTQDILMMKSKQQIKIEQLLKEAERESSSSKRQELILQMIRLMLEIQ
jgi:hypothetical protein